MTVKSLKIGAWSFNINLLLYLDYQTNYNCLIIYVLINA